ncbi:MAG: DUF1573 domain-containing protein [Planctomycetales bacterium]
MRLKMVRRFVGTLAVALSASTAFAQQWAEKMFDKLEHDFGVVARGAEAKYRLVITNKYRDDVHISNVRTSCGCTAATPSKDTLKSLEQAYIELTMDTKKFTAQKDSSVTITIDRPQPAEVRIPVRAFIRSDVVLSPGGANFGPITRGSDAERKIAVAYAGRENWTIRNVISKNPNIVAKVVETSRGGGRVNYDLVVTAKGSTPLGDFRDQLTLVTDDPTNPNLPVLVDGKVENLYAVTTELLDFGTLNAGTKKTMNLIVRGKQPFTIEKLESEHSAERFEVRIPVEAKAIHVIPLTLIAPAEAGTVTEEFTITIAGYSDPVTFKAHGKIVAAAGAAATTANPAAGTTTAQTNP